MRKAAGRLMCAFKTDRNDIVIILQSPGVVTKDLVTRSGRILWQTFSNKENLICVN